jgi:AraC-like DNA-binding protein
VADDPRFDPETQVLLSDIRMDGVGFSLAAPRAPFCVAGLHGPVSLCYQVRGGPIWLEVETSRRACARLEPGAVVGLSGLVPHWFKSTAALPTANAPPLAYAPLTCGVEPPSSAHLLIGHAPMESLAFTNTLSGAVIIPPDGGAVARRIGRAIEGIEDELREIDPVGGAASVVRRLSETILMNIARWAFGRTPELAFPLGAIGDPRIMRVIAAATRDPREHWTVARMAQVAGMSRTAFARRFLAITGDTPLNMVTRIRMRLAAETLTQGRGSLEAAVAAAGYGSSAAFIRAFRRAYHTTPARWRAAHALSHLQR